MEGNCGKLISTDEAAEERVGISGNFSGKIFERATFVSNNPMEPRIKKKMNTQIIFQRELKKKER